MEKCPTCDGTGEVHSHNPICWTCQGSGETTLEKAAQVRRLEESSKKHYHPRTGDYQ